MKKALSIIFIISVGFGLTGCLHTAPVPKNIQDYAKVSVNQQHMEYNFINEDKNCTLNTYLWKAGDRYIKPSELEDGTYTRFIPSGQQELKFTIKFAADYEFFGNYSDYKWMDYKTWTIDVKPEKIYSVKTDFKDFCLKLQLFEDNEAVSEIEYSRMSLATLMPSRGFYASEIKRNQTLQSLTYERSRNCTPNGKKWSQNVGFVEGVKTNKDQKTLNDFSVIDWLADRYISSKQDSNITKTEALFHVSNKLACNKKEDNHKYCECFADIISKNTVKPLKNEFVFNPEQSKLKLLRVYAKNSNEVDNICGKYIKYDLSIPDFERSSLLVEVLEKNRGKLLSPSSLKHMPELDKEEGWMFYMLKKEHNDFLNTVFRFKEEKSGEYYFDYVQGISSSEEKVTAKYKWKDGYRYHLNIKKRATEYKISEEESCKYTLGECEYTTYNGKVEKMYTEFIDGTWVRNVPFTRRSRALEVEVYDLQGLPLYYMTKFFSGGGYEERRVERYDN